MKQAVQSNFRLPTLELRIKDLLAAGGNFALPTEDLGGAGDTDGLTHPSNIQVGAGQLQVVLLDTL